MMLTVEKFKERLKRSYHPDKLLVGVDSTDESQLYIIVNGGMANINCIPIEQYSAGIRHCAREMITQGQLYLKANEKSLRIGKGRNLYCYTLKLDEDLPLASQSSRSIYFSSLFIRWQITHQVSDNQAQERLGLTAEEFHQFREDELAISPDLISKLTEVTGVSKGFWQNRWKQKITANKDK